LPERDDDRGDYRNALLPLNMDGRIMFRLVVIAALLLPGSLAEAASAQRGRTLALTNCSKCHSIDRVTPSPLSIAPPFRDLHQRYPVENLEEPLAEGIVTGHPSMPEFRLDPDQISDFIAFLKTLER
jgi:cytochrome c